MLLKIKIVIIFLLPAAYLPLSARVENWAVVRKGDKEGIIDLSTGKLVTPVIYDDIQPEQDLIQATKDSLVTLLDLTDGKEMFPLRYNYIQTIGSKYLKVYRNDKVGVIDYEGKEVVSVVYENMEYKDEYLYFKSDSSCVVINEEMEIII